MKEGTKKYADEAYETVKYAANVIGSRLPGSKGEKAFADHMADKLRAIGVTPKKEEFAVSPRSAIGGIPYAGYAGLIMSLAAYPALHIPSIWFAIAAFGILAAVWLISCCFLYQTWSDMFFPRKISQNVYGEITPPDGRYDYTIMLSAHTDTSWCWKHSEFNHRYGDNIAKGFANVIAKVGFGAVCFAFIIITAIFMSIVYFASYCGAAWAMQILSAAAFTRFMLAMHFIPAVTAIGSLFVIQWNDPHEENGSRGAMDNATGIALSYEITKYFTEHPEKLPKNCRIVDLNIGSEETGLRGSMAFTAAHKNDDLTENVWNINIDSIADEEYFSVINKDAWQFCNFDKDLEEMFLESFRELGIESKTGGKMANPVGGCDSTPMTRAGIKSVSFAAQNPTLTYYYHTWHDVPERFSADTLGDGFDVVLSVIDKIAAYQETNGFPGVRKK
ncbi:MAG: M28 family peptidase [Clostridia bacterium]|nr:M28 family peptidase [Clostridia bacterium]